MLHMHLTYFLTLLFPNTLFYTVYSEKSFLMGSGGYKQDEDHAPFISMKGTVSSVLVEIQGILPLHTR